MTHAAEQVTHTPEQVTRAPEHVTRTPEQVTHAPEHVTHAAGRACTLREAPSLRRSGVGTLGTRRRRGYFENWSGGRMIPPRQIFPASLLASVLLSPIDQNRRSPY